MYISFFSHMATHVKDQSITFIHASEENALSWLTTLKTVRNDFMDNKMDHVYFVAANLSLYLTNTCHQSSQYEIIFLDMFNHYEGLNHTIEKIERYYPITSAHYAYYQLTDITTTSDIIKEVFSKAEKSARDFHLTILPDDQNNMYGMMLLKRHEHMGITQRVP